MFDEHTEEKKQTLHPELSLAQTFRSIPTVFEIQEHFCFSLGAQIKHTQQAVH